MTEFHTAWSKLYKDFMSGLGQEFPQRRFYRSWRLIDSTK